MSTTVGAEFGHVRHGTLPPTLAPRGWARSISSFLGEHPFERNVFVMTRFPLVDDELGPVMPALEAIRPALADHGLTAHLASDRQLDDDLLGNVAAHMWACRFGVGLLEDRRGRGLNYNVVFEVGGMLVTGRRCALLKDASAPTLPSDIAGQIYKSVDFSSSAEVGASMHRWAADDLGFGRCQRCPD
jgi:hypothetical protein